MHKEETIERHELNDMKLKPWSCENKKIFSTWPMQVLNILAG